jgi:replicative DNA helicase
VKQTAEIVASLFEGRNGSCAIKRIQDGKKIYITYRNESGNDIPLSADLCAKHLKGEIALGSYPIDQDDNVKWACVDFDGKKGNALEDALVTKRAIEAGTGLVCWLERSQSGKGVHLWLFFDSKIKAKVVRAVVGKYIPEFIVSRVEDRKTSYDRMFPNQEHTEGGYGNLCALPLNGKDLVTQGKTAFIDDTGTPFPSQKETLIKITQTVNKKELFDVLLDKVKIDLPQKKFLPVMQTIPGGTKLLAPQGCAWLRKCHSNPNTLSEPEWYDAICQFAKVEQGEVLAHRFSQGYKGYSYKETQAKFDHAKDENKAPKCTTIWEKHGDCGKRCGHLGVTAPWEIAKVSLNKLDEGNKGKIYETPAIAKVGLDIVNEIRGGSRQGVAWGYDLLDDYTELRPRNLIVVAARQGLGKTAVMIDASIRGALRKVPQYIFSQEMGHEELALRFLARLAEINHDTIVTGKIGKEELANINKAAELLKTLPLFIDDSTREFDRMLDNAGELSYKHGTGTIWIDYLQLVKKRNTESKKEAVDRVVDGYKQMSKIVNCPVVALAQLNRSEEFAEGEEDLDSWLKDSGDIEQTADVIHYIRGQRGPGKIERRWRLHKERHRSSGINFRFMFDQGVFKFTCEGFWNKRAPTDEELYDKKEFVPDPDGFGNLV